MNEEDKILIPPEKISEGYYKEIDQIESLLHASNSLYDSKDYALSLAISLLAHEEISKLDVIQEHLKQKTGIMKSEWDDLTKKRGMHERKSTRHYTKARENIGQKTQKDIDLYNTFFKNLGHETIPTYDEWMKSNAKAITAYESLVKIKENCFYLSWEKEKWINLSTIASKEEIEALAFVQLLQSINLFYSAIFIKIRSSLTTLEIKTNPNYQWFFQHINIINSKEYAERAKIVQAFIARIQSDK